MIRTVIFDVDDTIYSFHHANEAAVESLSAYTRENFGWDRDEFLHRQKEAMIDIKQYAGTSGGYRTRLLRYQVMLEMSGIPIYPHALNMQRIYRDTLLDNMIPEDGIRDFLAFLKTEGLRIGIASDATSVQQFLKLERLGLLPYIDFIVTSEETGIEKPAEKFFLRCIEKCGCLPDEVMFIGDNPEKDYFGAKSAGYHAVWYNPFYKSTDEKMKELHNYAEGPDLIAEFNRITDDGGQ